MLLHHFIRDQAARRPEAVALRQRQETISYGELQTRVEAFAEGLLARGLGPSERVAVYLPKRAETVVALFGAAAVPVAGARGLRIRGRGLPLPGRRALGGARPLVHPAGR